MISAWICDTFCKEIRKNFNLGHQPGGNNDQEALIDFNNNSNTLLCDSIEFRRLDNDDGDENSAVSIQMKKVSKDCAWLLIIRNLVSWEKLIKILVRLVFEMFSILCS